MIEGVGGIVREITGTVIFGVCKVKGKNVERWPTYVLDYIKDVLTKLMKGETDYKSLIPCRSSYARLLPTGRKNYKPLPKDNGEGQKEAA